MTQLSLKTVALTSIKLGTNWGWGKLSKEIVTVLPSDYIMLANSKKNVTQTLLSWAKCTEHMGPIQTCSIRWLLHLIDC